MMVGYSGYEISRHKKQVVKPFLSENACYFRCQAQKITIYRGFNLISNSW